MVNSPVQMSCATCGSHWSADPMAYRCSCGGPWVTEPVGAFSPADVDRAAPGLWRYRTAMRVDGEPITLGEGLTPLVDWPGAAGRVKLKLDYVCPSGSYKDRGAAVLVTHFRQLGVSQAVEDSSGNAGAALAAYAARADIAVEIFVPADVHPGKLAQMQAHGARVTRVPGPRAATSEAVLSRAAAVPYASHNWNPVFLEGTKTTALEICEQLGWSAPAAVVCPLGFGSVLLGLWLGFDLLVRSGVIRAAPKLVGVQAAGYDPVFRAWQAGHDNVAPIGNPTPTPADGIAAAAPMRGRQILDAIRTSGGMAVAVEADAVWRGMDDLAADGFYVEPTSAVVVDGYRQALSAGLVEADELAVLALTGSGLKATDTWSERLADP